MALVKIKLFASLKDLAGQESLTIEIDKTLRLEELSAMVAHKLPALKDIIEGRKVLISINQEMAGKDDTVKDGDEVAFLPPFSGG